MKEDKPTRRVKSEEIYFNEQEIKGLQAEHSQIMVSLMKIKDMTLWRHEHSKALSIQNKIHELKTKNANMLAGKPPNGHSDWYDDYKFNS